MYTKTAYADDLITCIGVYGDNWQAYYAAAEYAYFHEHKRLPEWGCYLQEVEEVNGSYIFIHRDRDKAL